MLEKFYTVEEMANTYKMHPVSVLKLIKKKKLPALFNGRRYLLKKDDFENMLKKRTA